MLRPVLLLLRQLQAKLVMRAAARLAPQDVLKSVGPLQQTCLSLANTGNAAAAAAAAGGAGVSGVAAQHGMQVMVLDRQCVHEMILLMCTLTDFIT